MYYYQATKLPLRVKLSLIFGVIITLILLAFFAFTFFIIALCGSAALFLLNLFRRPASKLDKAPPHVYNPRPRDDDVIDI